MFGQGLRGKFVDCPCTPSPPGPWGQFDPSTNIRQFVVCCEGDIYLGASNGAVGILPRYEQEIRLLGWIQSLYSYASCGKYLIIWTSARITSSNTIVLYEGRVVELPANLILDIYRPAGVSSSSLIHEIRGDYTFIYTAQSTVHVFHNDKYLLTLDSEYRHVTCQGAWLVFWRDTREPYAEMYYNGVRTWEGNLQSRTFILCGDYYKNDSEVFYRGRPATEAPNFITQARRCCGDYLMEFVRFDGGGMPRYNLFYQGNPVPEGTDLDASNHICCGDNLIVYEGSPPMHLTHFFYRGVRVPEGCGFFRSEHRCCGDAVFYRLGNLYNDSYETRVLYQGNRVTEFSSPNNYSINCCGNYYFAVSEFGNYSTLFYQDRIIPEGTNLHSIDNALNYRRICCDDLLLIRNSPPRSTLFYKGDVKLRNVNFPMVENLRLTSIACCHDRIYTTMGTFSDLVLETLDADYGLKRFRVNTFEDITEDAT